MTYTILPTDALIVVDPQVDFCPGGALAVPGGDEIMGGINDLSLDFRIAKAITVVLQDWHPYNHKSFASVHEAEPFSVIDMPYGPQVLWPDHCVQATRGSDFHPDVEGTVARASVIIRKGMNPEIDSYSGFVENDKVTRTGLGAYLKDHGITRIFVVGLAYDYCVAATAFGGVLEGFETIVLKDLTRAIAADTSAQAEEGFREAGVVVADSGDFA